MVLSAWKFVAVIWFGCLSDFALYWILGWVLPILLQTAKILKTAFIFALGLLQWWPYSFSFLFLWSGFFFSYGMANGQLLTHLFWWAMCSFLIIALYPTRIVLTPGFIILNYNNFQGHLDKSFPASRGEFWVTVKESSRGGVVTPHQLECVVRNQAVLTCSEYVEWVC